MQRLIGELADRHYPHSRVKRARGIAGGIAGNFKPVVQDFVNISWSSRERLRTVVEQWREGIDRLSEAEANGRGRPGEMSPASQAVMEGKQLDDTRIRRES
jgi:hypothetical protein